MSKVRANVTVGDSHAESHRSSPMTCERATFLADRMSEPEQLGDSLVRVRLTRATGDDSSCEEFDVSSIHSSKPKAAKATDNIADVNYRNLQQSIASLSSENAALQSQLSTLALLKAQGDSLEMQVAAARRLPRPAARRTVTPRIPRR
jgi:hypothetical protein